MTRAFFFKTLLKSSLLKRKSRLLVAVVSLILGIALASALLNITFDVRERMSSEMSGYGPNVLLVPKDTSLQVGLGGLSFGSLSGEGFINESDLTRIESLKSAEYLVGYTPYLYAVVDMNNKNVVLSGVWFDSLMKINPSWKLNGEEIPDRGNMNSTVIGVSIAEKWRLKVGDSLQIMYEGKTFSLSAVGILSSGGSEDSQVFVSLGLAQDITQKNGLVHTVQLRYLVGGAELQAVAKELSEVISGVGAKVISQVAEAEESFLSKIQAVTAVLTSAVVAASAFAVMSTLSTTVQERRNEIGLMLALGASSRRIAKLFFAEVLMIGLFGGVVGYFLGVDLANVIWLRTFNVAIFPRLTTFPAILAIAVGVTFIASLLPIRQALRLTPAVTLRGE